MKRILTSVLTIAAVVAVGYLATSAFFSDTETSVGNLFQAGAIDLKIDYDGYYNKVVDGQPNAGSWELTDLNQEHRFFDFDDIKPGDYGEGTISLLVYNNDAWACATITPTSNDDVSSTEPELEAGDVENDVNNLWDGELAQNMQFKIWADVCNVEATPGDNIYQEGCDILLTQGTGPLSPVTWPLADSTANVFTGVAGQPIIGSQDYFIGVEWTLPSSVGNIVQTDKYTADISFYAEQSRNNPDFKCVKSFVKTYDSGGNNSNKVTVYNGYNLPHVNYQINGTCIEFDFINPTPFQFLFDYRVDGEAGTDWSLTNTIIGEGPLEGQPYGQNYNWVNLLGGQSQTVNVCGQDKIEVGLRVGAERNWYFDWIVFEAI